MLLPVQSLLLNTGGGVTISEQPTRLIGAESCGIHSLLLLLFPVEET
jgi:hypothetical protein